MNHGIVMAALDANPACDSGILARERMAWTANGPMSFRNDQELFVRVSTAVRYKWYGHVLRADDLPDGGQRWVAVLVNSEDWIDAPDVETLFARVQHWLEVRCRYTPGHAVEDGQLFAIRSSFQDAVKALVAMIRGFDPLRRTVQWTELGFLTPPGRLDARLMDVYGCSCRGGVCGGEDRDPEVIDEPRAPAPYWDEAGLVQLLGTAKR